ILDPGNYLSVSCVDVDGANPIPGAKILLTNHRDSRHLRSMAHRLQSAAPTLETPDEAPVPGPSETSVFRVAVSNSQGVATFYGLPTGTYQMMACHTRFSLVEASVALGSISVPGPEVLTQWVEPYGIAVAFDSPDRCLTWGVAEPSKKHYKSPAALLNQFGRSGLAARWPDADVVIVRLPMHPPSERVDGQNIDFRGLVHGVGRWRNS